MAARTLVLNNLGLKGINTDIAPWDLPPEFITSGVNFRINGDQIISSAGASPWSTPPVDFKAGFLQHIGATSGDYWLAPGRTAVYAFDGNAWTDVSSEVIVTAGSFAIGTEYTIETTGTTDFTLIGAADSLPGTIFTATGVGTGDGTASTKNEYAGIGTDDELNWTGCMLGQIPIVNNPQHHPEYWSPQSPGQAMQALNFSPGVTWDDSGNSFKIIRSHKNFLFALNLTESAAEQPTAYRWSHPADINGLPFTWDETDDSAIAGKAQIGGDGGVIIDGLSMRDSFVIYAETSITILDFTGDEFVWRARELSSTVGLVSKQGLVEVRGRHYFLADGDIVVNDGNTVNSIVHNKIRRHLTSRLNAEFYHRSFAVRNDAVKEIWFCVPIDGAEHPNVAYIYNYEDDSWAIRNLPPNLAYAAYGPQAEPTTLWSDWGGTWDQQTRVWGSRKRTPLDDTLVGINHADSTLIVIDPHDNSECTCEYLGTVIERTDFALGGMLAVNSVNRVYPHIDGTAEVSIQLGSQEKPGGPVRWKPAVSFLPGTDRKIDIRTTGELLCWRVSSIGLGNFRLAGLTIEYTDNGYR